jgi:hypothetical protein
VQKVDNAVNPVHTFCTESIGVPRVARANTRAWLGALSGEQRNFVVTVFVPSQTRDGAPLDHAFWRTEALTVMAGLFGGATAIEGDGAWCDDERDGAVKVERVSTVESFMPKSSWNKETAARLGEFLRRMGREAQQGEVGLIVDGEYFPIREFDK